MYLLEYDDGYALIVVPKVIWGVGHKGEER